MKSESTVKKAVIKKVAECIKMAESIYGKNIHRGNSSNPTISFGVKGRVAGKCHTDTRYFTFDIQFNLQLARENFDEFINDTVPHEVSHMIDCIIHGGYRKSKSGRNIFHDKTFKKICQSIGCSGNTCHSYAPAQGTRRMARNHVYTCSCDTHKLTKILHNRILKGQKRFCRKCKSQIEFSHTEAV